MYRALLASILIAFSGFAYASNVDDIQALAQQQFKDLSADLASVIQFRQLSSAEPGGITGFHIGIGISATQVKHNQAWKTATGGNDVGTVPMARLRVRKGLPGGFDIGGYYSTAPNSNIKAYGFELRYAILEGSVVTPALGLRATYNKITGIDNLQFHTSSLGLSLSKGFGPFTPYIGVGHIWVSSNPASSTYLTAVDPGLNQVFVGFNLDFVVFDVALQADRIGDNTTYSLKLAFGF